MRENNTTRRALLPSLREVRAYYPTNAWFEGNARNSIPQIQIQVIKELLTSVRVNGVKLRVIAPKAYCLRASKLLQKDRARLPTFEP